MEQTVIAISVQPVRDERSFRGRKYRNDVYLSLKTQGGTVYLRRSVVEEAGGSWQRLIDQARASALKHCIPFQISQA